MREFGSSPFSSLDSNGLPEATPKSVSTKTEKFKNVVPIGKGERLEIRREKSGRGGKTVTTIKGFPVRINQKERTKLLKILKSSLGTGGTWNASTMELQGDRREDVFCWFKNAGFVTGACRRLKEFSLPFVFHLHGKQNLRNLF